MDEALYLIEKIKKKDKKAFRKFYDLFYEKVFFYIYHVIKNKDSAEDILIETFFEVWKSAAKFKKRATPISWVLGIARNISLKYLKKKEEEINDVHIKFDEDIERSLKQQELKQILEKAFLHLSLEHREILNLVFYQELSYLEIAKILDIPVNTVKTRVFYAKKNLKEILYKMGVKDVL